MCAGARRQLLSGDLWRKRLLVAPSTGHHVVGVRDGHESTGVGDVLASNSFGVTRSIKAGMMFRRCLSPVPEPVRDRFEVDGRLSGVGLENCPLLICGSPVLVQDLGGDFELSNVVEKRSPAQLVEIITAHTEFFGEQLRIGPYAFGVAPREPVVLIHVLQQLHQVLGAKGLDASVLCGRLLD